MIIDTIFILVFGLYTLVLFMITFYCLIQFHLLLKYVKARKKLNNKHPLDFNLPLTFPTVTVQLPLYNERFVVERLLENIVKLEYPAGKLQIQVLDDSTDDTRDLCIRKVEEYKSNGIPIEYVHRANREGYKAGALRDGMSQATGEFLAIFDADFLPDHDFLLKTIPHFSDERIGAVQTRWAHLNGQYSLITKLQAFQLNVHFSVEQTGRQEGNYFLQFNGTAGVWRRKAIEDAGGWHADTLTEDLDLSIRAQLKGWKIKFCQDMICPAEVPAELNGMKSQQYRWMKGGAENARKYLGVLFKSNLSPIKKIHAIFHLLSSTIFLMVFLLAILSVPVLFMSDNMEMNLQWYWVFMIALPALGSVYFRANSDTTWIDDPLPTRVWKFIVMFPLFLSLSMGLSLHNSIAVIQGYWGKKTPFERTPKFNIQQLGDTFRKGFYGFHRITFTTVLEGLLSVYFLFAVLFGIEHGKTNFLVYHLMLMVGFGFIFIYTIKHLGQK